jgi:hypothetical protein
MKRSGRLNPKSKKTAKEDRELAPIRRAFVEEMGGDHCHEIVGGASRHKTKLDRRFWLAVKSFEHDAIQYEPKAKQMARKLCQDGAYFDLDAVNAEYRSHGKEWPITFEQIGGELWMAIENGGF